jgi:hypothetical protein
METALQVAMEQLQRDPEATPQSVTWRDTLGDHCFWEGMDDAKVVKPDWVRLYPKWFGS